jgi:hypothetical protein
MNLKTTIDDNFGELVFCHKEEISRKVAETFRLAK